MSHVKHNLCLSFGRAGIFMCGRLFFLFQEKLKVDRISEDLWNIPTCLKAYVLDRR